MIHAVRAKAWGLDITKGKIYIVQYNSNGLRYIKDDAGYGRLLDLFSSSEIEHIHNLNE